MANTIALASLFQKNLDAVMIQELTSGWMEANASQVQYNGGNTIRIAKIALTGLGTYDRATGYPAGSVTLSWETFTFTMDRGASFMLDSMDEDESAFVASASNILGEFQRTKVAPEVDAYRYSKLYTLALAASKTEDYTAAVATIFAKLKSNITTVQNIVGETEPLVIAMSMPVANILDQADEIKHELSNAEMMVGDVATKVRALDGIPIIKVPSARMYSAYTFSATDGFTPVAGAEKINWVIMAKRSVIAVVKTDKIKIIDPATNQNADAYKIMLRKYHDMWVPDNKMDGIFVNFETVA